MSLITILMKSYKFKLFKLYVLDKNDVVYAKNHNVAKNSFFVTRRFYHPHWPSMELKILYWMPHSEVQDIQRSQIL